MGHVLTYDLSIPPDKFEWFSEQIYYGRKGPYNAYYGHLGDGNIHYNIVFENVEEMHKEQERVEEKIITLTKNLNGSISAEHGVGQLKRHYMQVQKGKETYGYMKDLKKLFDPNEILNPGKLL